ncbi:MAG TPA: hypothetical protein VG188_05745 [Solirubrobacteraceae bacterium]|jgi:hypothetical protein|nr:hypothetical protein [Solirubrobacteraceae bacterium]
MNDFFDSLKSDLLDRRLIPALGLVAVVLVAAVAYAVLGGGSSAPASNAASPIAPVAKSPGLAVSEVKTADVTASAETTSGSPQQTAGASRNPFAPMPGVKQAQAASAAATSAATSSGSSTTTTAGASGSESSSSSTGGSTPAPAEEKKKSSAPTKPKAKQTQFHVDVLFGAATPATPPQSAALTPFNELKLQQPLPSSSQPLVVFRGVLAGGKSATFTLVGEAILRGPATCLPSASQCQAIDLQPGQTEELEYLPPGADAITYELNIVSISSSKAKLSSAHSSAFGGESRSGLELLRKSGLQGLSGLRYSTARGVLVFVGKHALAARAHTAAAAGGASAPGWPFKG